MLTSYEKQPIIDGFRACHHSVAGRIAERIQKRNYDFRPLVELFGDVLYSSKEIAETLLSHYFEFSRIIALQPDDFGCSRSELNSSLCILESLYRAIRAIDSATADIPAVPVPVLSDN